MCFLGMSCSLVFYDHDVCTSRCMERNVVSYLHQRTFTGYIRTLCHIPVTGRARYMCMCIVRVHLCVHVCTHSTLFRLTLMSQTSLNSPASLKWKGMGAQSRLERSCTYLCTGRWALIKACVYSMLLKLLSSN